MVRASETRRAVSSILTWNSFLIFFLFSSVLSRVRILLLPNLSVTLCNYRVILLFFWLHARVKYVGMC